jgi:hypothetical protein
VARGAKPPKPVPIVGLLDTGATGIAVDYVVSEQLGLRPTDYASHAVAGGVRIAPKIVAALSLPVRGAEYCLIFQDCDCVLFNNLKGWTGVDALIGLRVLRSFVILIDGPKDTCRLCKPAVSESPPSDYAAVAGSDYYDPARDRYLRFVEGAWREYRPGRSLWRRVKLAFGLRSK